MKNKLLIKLKLTITFLLCIAMSLSFTACDNIENDVEQTNNSLTIYDSTNNLSPTLVNKYKSLYPDVEVSIIARKEDEDFKTFESKMSGEILAGKGPDLILMSNLYYRFNNLPKMIKAGAFTDISDLTKKDKDFNVKDYNDVIMKFGVYDGKRFIMPIEYNIPLLLTSQKMLDKTKFNISNCTNYWSFMDEIVKYSETCPEGVPNIMNTGISNLSDFFCKAGINVIEKDKILVDSPDFKRGAEYINKIGKKFEWLPKDAFSMPFADSVIDEKAVFANCTSGSFGVFFGYYFNIIDKGQKPVFLPIRDVNGKIQAEVNKGVAITNSSQNKQNAYNFLKLLLDKDSQIGEVSFPFDPMSIPVSNEAINYLLDDKLDTPIKINGDKVVPFSKAERKECFDQYKSILADVNQTTKWDTLQTQILMEITPYLSGEKSYQECVDKIKNNLEISLSE